MSEHDDKTPEKESEGGVATLVKPKVKEPSMYHVILLNDDYTTMDFVMHVLQKFFRKSLPEANRIMMSVHQQGRGTCGLYPFDIAETKVMQVNECSKESQMPLKCIMEKE